MAKNHIQPGKAMPYANASGSLIPSGAVVIVGLMVCIALGDIANGAIGEVATEEVWEVPKDTATEMLQGTAAYWDVADGEINATAEDNYYAGLVFEDAAAAAATVKVKLGAYGLLTNLV